MMFGVPISIIIGLLAVMIGGWLQRRQWYRNTREEIRVRETDEATKLISEIARIVDKRIACQRALAYHSSSDEREDNIREYRGAIRDYGSEINYIRARLRFFFSYDEVKTFEKMIHDRIVANGRRVEARYSSKGTEGSLELVIKELDVVSAKTYRLCARLSGVVAAEKFGTLRKVDDWSRSDNPYVSVGTLARRLLNI